MNPDQHNVRRVQLPGGKVIEVVYLDHPRGGTASGRAGANPKPAPNAPAKSAPAARRPAAKPVPVRDLHVCPRCSSTLVHPVDWAESGPTHWEVLLRCPECHFKETGVFTQLEVDRFDAELDRGTEVLVRDLQQLAHANMAEQVERFVEALRRDFVVPSDF
jgi:hypothetical protein